MYLNKNFPEVYVPSLEPWWFLPFTLLTAIKVYREKQPQVLVASSFGAVLCTVMMFLRIVHCPVILLAPPFPTVLRFLWISHLAARRSLILVHGIDDGMSFWKTSMKQLHPSLHQIVVNDNHALNTLLADGALLSLVSIALTCSGGASQ